MNKIITIDEATAFPKAKEYFMKSCHIDITNYDIPRNQKIMEDAKQIHKEGHKSIAIRSIVAGFEPEILEERKISFGDIQIECNLFEQLDQTKIIKIWMYLLTVGNMTYSNDNPMNFFYADLWETSYLDSGMDLLRGEVEDLSKEICFIDNRMYELSEEFGPGYFGMSILESGKFCKILHGEQIGVTSNGSGLMIPAKTCTGLFFLTDGKILGKENEECKSCMGNPLGCEFCRKMLDKV